MNIDFRDGLPGDEQPQVETVFIVKFGLGDNSAEVFITDPGFPDISIGTIRGEKLMEMLSRTCSALLTESLKGKMAELSRERPF